MNRLLDGMNCAGRKRRDLRPRRSGVAAAAPTPPDKARWAEASAAVAAQKKAAVNVSDAEDELFWAEVKRRLAEAEQRRRVRDAFSPDEVRALALAAGVNDLLAGIGAGAAAAKRDVEELAQWRAEQDLGLQLPAAERAAAARPSARTAVRQAGRRRAGAGWRRLAGRRALAALAFALAVGASALWLQPATQSREASSRLQAAQPGTSAAQLPAGGAPALKIDADSTGFAERAAITRRSPR